MNYVTDALIDLQLPENSKVAFISYDGREISTMGDVKRVYLSVNHSSKKQLIQIVELL